MYVYMDGVTVLVSVFNRFSVASIFPVTEKHAANASLDLWQVTELCLFFNFFIGAVC